MKYANTTKKILIRLLKSFGVITCLFVLGSVYPIYNQIKKEHIRFKLLHKKTPGELEHYVKLINLISNGKLGKNTKHLGFRYNRPTKSMKNVIGSCNYSVFDLQYEIDIYKDTWTKMNHLQKLFLVAHELRHCECKFYKHINIRFFETNCPFSYMNASAPHKLCLKQHKSHYL